MVVNADERLTEFVNWMTNPYSPISRYHRLREEEDYENFLADAPISYISEGVWEYGPGYVCVVVGIRRDYTFRAEVWKLDVSLDSVGVKEVLYFTDDLTFEDIQEFTNQVEYFLIWNLRWTDSRQKIVSKFGMKATEGNIYQLDSDVPFRENRINENKQVTFNGEFSPQFGWILVLAGGPGSGKGFAKDHYIQLSGKTFDVDKLKELYAELIDRGGLRGYPAKNIPDRYAEDPKVRDGFTAKPTAELWREIIQQDVYGNKVEHPVFRSYEPVIASYDFSNPEDVQTLHKTVKKLNWKQKTRDTFLNGQKQSHVLDAENARLPNITLDITGKDAEDLLDTATLFKETLGYKIAIVWIVTDVQSALLNNYTRKRQVLTDIVVKVHSEVRTTFLETLIWSGKGSAVDEAWILFSTQFLDRIRNKFGNDMANYLETNQALRLEKNADRFVIPEKAQKYLELLTAGGTASYGADKIIKYKDTDDLFRQAEKVFGSKDAFEQAFKAGEVDIKPYRDTT